MLLSSPKEHKGKRGERGEKCWEAAELSSTSDAEALP